MKKKDLHKGDNLEGFFKRSFKNQNDLPADDGWDLPADDVWDDISASIEKKPKKRFIVYQWKWIAIAATIVLGVFTYQLVSWNTKLDNLTQSIQKNTQSIDQIEANIQVAPIQQDIAVDAEILSLDDSKKVSSVENRGNQSKEVTTSKVNAIVSGTKKILQPKQIFSPSIAANSSDIIDQQINPSNQLGLLPQENEKVATTIITENNNKFNLEKKPAIKAATDLLTRKELIALSNSKEKESIINSFPWIPVTPVEQLKRSTTKGFSVGIHSGISRPKMIVQSQRPAGPNGPPIDMLKKQEVANFSIGGGVQVGYHFNEHWSIESGLTYNQSKISSEHIGMLRFTHSNEMLNSDGTYQSDYSYPLPTSFGMIDTDVSVSRDVNSTIAENEPIEIKVQSTAQIKFLGIPIVGKYRFGKNNLALTVKAGIQANKVIDSQFEITATSSNHEIVKPNPPPHHRPRKLKDLKSTSLHYIAGVGLDYKLTEQLHLTAEPTFMQSITPISFKDDLKVYPIAMNFNVGMNYYF